MDFRPKENRILTALSKGDIPLGMQVYTGNPSIIEILAYTGFDFYMLDMEHSRVNPETMEHCIRAADAAGITTLVRVTENNPSLIRHAIEAGAQGVIVPHIENTEDARQAVDAIRYPPEVNCGTCGCIRAASYKSTGYMEYSNQNTILCLLLEDKTAIENADEIMAQLKPGLDAVGIGRGDLMNSLRTEPEENSGKFIIPGEKDSYIQEAYDKVIAIFRKREIPLVDNMFSPNDAKVTMAKNVKILVYMIDQ